MTIDKVRLSGALLLRPKITLARVSLPAYSALAVLMFLCVHYVA